MKNTNQCLWLLGLSGAGKTTLANCLIEKFKTEGKKCILLDGDVLRTGLNKNLGFSDADRSENVRRTAEVAKLFLAEGYWVIVALITPLESMRASNRAILGEAYVEIFIDTSLKTCQERDPKGLYAKVARREITHFTGIDSPFEIPQNADLVVNTKDRSVEECVQQIQQKFKQMNITKKTTQINNFTVAYYSENDLEVVKQEIFIDKEYYFEADKPNPVIIDCGANIGLATLYFKELYPDASVYAFEANPFIFKLLEENIRINNLTDVHCFNAALSDVETTQMLSFPSITSFGGTIAFPHKNWVNIPVKTTKLSNYITDLTSIDLMKIDVEGAEIQIINDLFQAGMLQLPSQYILEYHYERGKPMQLGTFLSKFEQTGFNYQLDAVRHFGTIHCVMLQCKKR